MIDIFLQKDVTNLLKNKNIVFMGDSNIRALYKDVLCLVNQNKLISQKVLKTKGENSCFGDKLLFVGPKYNGREYKEEREGSHGETKLSFYFLTRVYDDYVKRVVSDLSRNKQNLPDILILNSCLWDVTRWGPDSVKLYKKNMVLLMQDLKEKMPDCLVIWVTAPPIACNPSGGFLVKEIEFLKYSIRFHVVEANHYARKVVVDHGFDVVDSHYHLKLEIHRRTTDGIHWYPEAVRYVTNLLLTHTSIAWNVTLPHRFKTVSLDDISTSISDEEDTIEPKISKVSSDAVKAEDIVKCIKDEQKENAKKRQKITFTPKRPKKKKKALAENSQFQQSHHSFIKRVEYKERHRRIREWQNNVEHSPCGTRPVENRNFPNYQQFQAHCSTYINQDNSGCHTNLNNGSYPQQGFINSPTHAPIHISPYQQPHNSYINHDPYNTYDQQRFKVSPMHRPLLHHPYQRPRKVIIGSPMSPVSYTFDPQRYIDSPRHIPLPPNPYKLNITFLNSPLPVNARNMHTPPRMHESLVRNMQVSPYASFSNEPHQAVQNSYIPDASNWVQFRPQINFAATNCVPFGVQF